jgi:hypothetical protein
MGISPKFVGTELRSSIDTCLEIKKKCQVFLSLRQETSLAVKHQRWCQAVIHRLKCWALNTKRYNKIVIDNRLVINYHVKTIPSYCRKEYFPDRWLGVYKPICAGDKMNRGSRCNSWIVFSSDNTEDYVIISRVTRYLVKGSEKKGNPHRAYDIG